MAHSIEALLVKERKDVAIVIDGIARAELSR
jgi:hypothetical protein